MASMPPPTAGFNLASAGSFLVNLGASYMLGRLMAPDGPRLQNREAGGGEYGVAMPRIFGTAVRITPPILAQADIEEHEHSVEDYSELVGAATGAIQGFMVGGPVGAVAGAVIGGLLGAATPDQKFYTYSCTLALLLADRLHDDPIEGLTKLWGGGKMLFKHNPGLVESEALDSEGRLVRRKYKKNKWFDSLTIYGGGNEQTVDPVLENAVDEDSAYRYRAYAVVEGLRLGQFGNSVPALDALVASKNGQDLSEVAEVICAAAGIDHEHDMSSTALVGNIVRGYALTSETNCWDALKPLLPVFRVDASEVSGQVRFYKRAQSMRATIPTAAMGAHAYGDTPPEAIRFNRTMDTDLPKQTSLTFVDLGRDYQPNTASPPPRAATDATSIVNVNIPLVMTADEAAEAAAVIHWDAWLGRRSASFSVTDQYLGLEPGLAYGLQVPGGTLPFVLKRKLRGANGIIECDAVSDESVTYTVTATGTSGTIPPEESTEFADTRLVLIDGPILEDAHDDYGFYVVVAGSEADWNFGWVEASGNGTTFARIAGTGTGGIVGDVTGTLAAGSTTGLDDALDTTSVLTVALLHDGMTLSSATDAELDAYANFAYVGKNGLGEYLQFKTATKVGAATWELTNLRRGRKGTDHAIASHASGEEFALLNSGRLRIVYADTDKWGEAMTFRGVTLEQDAGEADTQTFTNTGEGKRPYSPVNVQGSWDGSNNLTIIFDARSRMNSGGLGVDDNAEWEVEITTGAGRVELTATESFIYTAADQTADGITPGDSISGRVRQTSDVNDGRWRDFIFVGPLDRTADTTVFTADSTFITADIA